MDEVTILQGSPIGDLNVSSSAVSELASVLSTSFAILGTTFQSQFSRSIPVATAAKPKHHQLGCLI